jgi:hypothetical protein
MEKLNITSLKKIRLGNNTTLSLYEDADKNLWVGLDRNQLHKPSISIQNFVITGILGTVYIKAAQRQFICRNKSRLIL